MSQTYISYTIPQFGQSISRAITHIWRLQKNSLISQSVGFFTLVDDRVYLTNYSHKLSAKFKMCVKHSIGILSDFSIHTTLPRKFRLSATPPVQNENLTGCRMHGIFWCLQILAIFFWVYESTKASHKGLSHGAHSMWYVERTCDIGREWGKEDLVEKQLVLGSLVPHVGTTIRRVAALVIVQHL